jgi:hypothetical protein
MKMPKKPPRHGVTAFLDEIESGGMPPACDGDDPGDPSCVNEEDLEVLEQWVDDDTPE